MFCYVFAMRKILVIDENTTVRDSLRALLGQKEYEVVFAGNVSAGRELARTDDFELVLMDLAMTGAAWTEVVKKEAAGSSTPVIVMTGDKAARTAVEAVRNGAFDSIAKPFTPEELGLVLDRALAVAALRKENLMLKARLKEKCDLKHVIEHASLNGRFSSGGREGDRGDDVVDLNEMLGSLERGLIVRALEKTGGVRSRAARLLRLNRTTLIEKMKKMGIELRKRSAGISPAAGAE